MQESIITIRSDRYVVPVKSEHKNAIPGLVHDVSSSGSTFFIEPMGVVKANNELRELLAKEKKGDRADFGRAVRPVRRPQGGYREDYQLLVWLDAIFARAKLSLKLECTEPKLSDKCLHLRGVQAPSAGCEKRRWPTTSPWGETLTLWSLPGPTPEARQ